MTRILQVKDLRITFPVNGQEKPAVDGLTFGLEQGEVLGIVGESGCGKTVTALSLLRLIEAPGKIRDGQAYYYGTVEGIPPTEKNELSAEKKSKTSDYSERDGEDVTPYEDLEHKPGEHTASLLIREPEPEGGIDLFRLSDDQMRKIRGNKIAMIFQEPMTSLNPVFTVGYQIMEAIMLHQKVGRAEAEKIAIEMLRKVRIPDPEKRIHDYPHQMSGGMRQRVMIAMALSCQPDILIADEPTTALDVTIQAQILELIRELIQEMHMSVILITHDLGVVAQVCDKVLVMYAGMAVEKAPVRRIFRLPKHPYTIGLLESIPKLFDDQAEALHAIAGTVPDLSRLPKGCRFADRCPRAVEACRGRIPKLKYVGEGQEVRCINY
jgi:peptide/nickel transport system ATP-binding protein